MWRLKQRQLLFMLAHSEPQSPRVAGWVPAKREVSQKQNLTEPCPRGFGGRSQNEDGWMKKEIEQVPRKPWRECHSLIKHCTHFYCLQVRGHLSLYFQMQGHKSNSLLPSKITCWRSLRKALNKQTRKKENHRTKKNKAKDQEKKMPLYFKQLLTDQVFKK